MKGFLFFILIVSFGFGKAQSYYEFPTDSTSWSFSFYSPISNSLGSCSEVVHYGIFGDTVIAGATYFKLYRYTQNGENLNDSNPGFLIEQAAYYGALRSDASRKVYYIAAEETGENLFMDFALQIGDTFCFDLQGDGCHEVTAIDSQLINHTQYRRSISFDNGIKWVEGIGYWTSGFFGYPTMGYWELNCHSYKSKQLIGVAGNCSCVENEQVTSDQWHIVSVEYFENTQSGYVIYPNPTTGKVTIQFEKEYEKCTIHLSELNGKTLFSNQYHTVDTITLDLESVGAGLYIIHVETDNEKAGEIIIKK